MPQVVGKKEKPEQGMEWMEVGVVLANKVRGEPKGFVSCRLHGKSANFRSLEVPKLFRTIRICIRIEFEWTMASRAPIAPEAVQTTPQQAVPRG